jgi:DNA polymerase
MDEYCAQDVRTEMAVAAQLRALDDDEWADYYANCRINDRGVRIDRVVCDAAQAYAEEEIADLVERIEEVTEGAVVKARGEKLKAWVVERLTEEQERLLVKYRDGERKLSLDKYNRARLLALDDLNPDVKEVVECSDFAQKSSVGKFKAMGRIADPEDDRVRGAIMCNGASASGRYSSKGLQLHNFPRTSMDDPEEVRQDFIDEIVPEDMVDYYNKPIMTILSHMLRPALVPALGNVFLVSDWSAIEGRIAPWLCDNDMGEDKLNLYRNDAPVYELAAATTFGVPVEEVTALQRQVGKVEELAFQFQGGANAFLTMARNYGLKATKSEANRYKDAWRRVNPWAPRIWADIERAARRAVASPGEICNAGRLRYFSVANVLAGGITLFCQLPCGRLLTYPDVRVEMKKAPWGEEVPSLTTLRAAFVPKASEKEWPRSGLYGGLLFENAVQGTGASLLRNAIRQAERGEVLVVFHVHDELVAEVPRPDIAVGQDRLEYVMNTNPEWATGLPLKADVNVMERFGK